MDDIQHAYIWETFLRCWLWLGALLHGVRAIKQACFHPHSRAQAGRTTLKRWLNTFTLSFSWVTLTNVYMLQIVHQGCTKERILTKFNLVNQWVIGITDRTVGEPKVSMQISTPPMDDTHVKDVPWSPNFN